MIQLFTIVSLVVGTLLYHSEMGWPTVGKYWAVYWGALLLEFFLPGFVVMIVQAFTAAVFFAHVKVKAAGLS